VVPDCEVGDRLTTVILGDGGIDNNNEVTAATTSTQAGPGTTDAWVEIEEDLPPNGATDWLSSASAEVTGAGDITVRVDRTQTGTVATWGFVVVRTRGMGDIGDHGRAAQGSTEVVNLDVSADSWVIFGSGSWVAGTPATAFTPAGAEELHGAEISGQNTYQVLLWKDQAAGNRNYGSTDHPSTNLRCVAVEILAGAAATNLTPADAAHAHTADQPALTQVHALTPADAAHGHAADQPALTQVHVLSGDDALHGHTAEQPALTQVHALTGADALPGHTAEQPALTQVHVLAPDSALHAHTTDATTVDSSHIISPADALHGHTVDQPALTQVHQVAADDAAHGHTAEQASLSQVHALPAADALHAHTADQPSLTQLHQTPPADALHAHTADQPTLTQVHEVRPPTRSTRTPQSRRL
jgi:hypothetical protein